MLTRSIHPNTTDLGNSRGPSKSRNCEMAWDAFARPVFRRLDFFRPAPEGDDLQFRRIFGQRAISSRQFRAGW